MSSLTRTPLLHQEGKHHRHEDLEFWAEEGIVCIIDHRNGDVNAVTCNDFKLRAACLNRAAKRATTTEEANDLYDWTLKMYEVWQNAKDQGDPSDPEVMKQKLRQRRRAVMVTGLDW
jgi:hypothetical protein